MKRNKWLSIMSYPPQLLKTIILTLFYVAVVCVNTLYFSRFTDSIAAPELCADTVWKGFFIYILLESIMMLVNFLYDVGYAHIRGEMGVSIRNRVMESMLNGLTPELYEEISRESISSIVINDMKMLRQWYVSTQINAVRTAIRFAALIGLMFYFAGALGIWMLVLMGVLFAVSGRCSRALEKWGIQEAEANEEYLKTYRECLEVRRDYKYAGKDELLNQKMEQTNEALEKIMFECGRRKVQVSTLNTLFRNGSRCTVIGLELLLVVYANLSVGAILAALNIFSMLEDEISAIQNVIECLSETKSICERVYDTVQRFEENQETEEEVPEKWSSFGLRNVSFGYDEKLVLQETNLEFRRGKKYILMGESGCGKSTLLKVLLGIHPACGGHIFIDEEKLPSGSKKVLQMSSFLSQSFYLFQDSVKNNIFFGNRAYEENLKRTGYECILEQYIPDLQKQVEKNGSNLSGGQKQVVGIARALARGKKILVFDESFSAADEKLFEELIAFLKQMKDMTVILISHRRQDLEGYDGVFELTEGKIYEK